MEKKCANEVCGISFEIPARPEIGWDRLYCSQNCKEDARRIRFRERLLKPGDRFTRLVLVEIHSSGGRQFWRCHCDCGNKFIARSDKLRSGRQQSCGCLRAERIETAKAAKLARERERWQERVQRQTLTLGLVDQKRVIVRSKKAILDYHNFDLSASPWKAAKEFQEWAFIVCNVLMKGPKTDIVTIRAHIEVKR